VGLGCSDWLELHGLHRTNTGSNAVKAVGREVGRTRAMKTFILNVNLPFKGNNYVMGLRKCCSKDVMVGVEPQRLWNRVYASPLRFIIHPRSKSSGREISTGPGEYISRLLV
jgi:hypothetical protein